MAPIATIVEPGDTITLMKRVALVAALLLANLASVEPIEGRQSGLPEKQLSLRAPEPRDEVFRLHSQAGRVLFEIPPQGLGRYFHLKVYNTEPVDTLAWKHQGWGGGTFRFELMDSSLALVRWNVILYGGPEGATTPPSEVIERRVLRFRGRELRDRRMGQWDYEVIQWLYGHRDSTGRSARDSAGAPASVHWIRSRELDYRSTLHTLGDDPIAATHLGLANIRRLAPRVANYTDLDLVRANEPTNRGVQGLFERLVLTWQRELAHVVGLVGGFTEERRSGELAPTVAFVSADRQAEAVMFLTDHAFAPPEFFLTAEMEAALGDPPSIPVAEAQSALLRLLLSDQRLRQIVSVSMEASDHYDVDSLLGDLAAELFNSDDTGANSHDDLRRRLQRQFVERLIEIRAAPDPDLSRLKASAVGQLNDLSRRLASLADTASSTSLARHYQQLAELIGQATR